MQQLGFIPPGTDVMPLARRIPALMDPWLDGGGGRNFDPEEALEVGPGVLVSISQHTRTLLVSC